MTTKTKYGWPEKFIFWSIGLGFALGAGFIIYAGGIDNAARLLTR